MFHGQLTRSWIFSSTAFERAHRHAQWDSESEQSWQHAYCFVDKEGTWPCSLADLLRTTQLSIWHIFAFRRVRFLWSCTSASSELLLYTKPSQLTCPLAHPSNACMAYVSGHFILYPCKLKAFLLNYAFLCKVLSPVVELLN